MKKKLLALAVASALAAPVAAMADTNVYGLLDATVANINGTGQKSQTLLLSGGLAASRIGVKATEDVGDGLTAIALWEINVDSQNATDTSGTARQKMLALSSASMGTVAAGYLQTAGYDFAAKYDPTAGSAVSALQNMTSGTPTALIGNTAGATRAQRALAYISPNMGGFTLALNHAMTLVGAGNLGAAAAAADTNITATLLSANYDAGPLAVGGVYASTSNPSATSTANLKEYALGASYDMGSAKLSGTWQSSKVNAAASPANNNNKIYSISGVIPAGAGAVALTYAHATIGTDTTGNSNGTSYTAAYLHTMSKTLTGYAAYSRTTEGSASSAFSVANGTVANGNLTLGGSTNLLCLGLSKKF